MTRGCPLALETEPVGNFLVRGHKPARLNFRLDEVQYPLLRSRQFSHTTQKSSIRLPDCQLSILLFASLFRPLRPDQFVFAELTNEGKEQRLRLVFATHEVLIHGDALKRIETAMQRRELSFLAELPSGQRRLIKDGQPIVLEIAVTETQEKYLVNSSE